MSLGNVLTEQYVDIVARNLRETMDALRAIQRQADLTGESFKRLKQTAAAGAGGGAAAGVVSPRTAAPGGIGATIAAAAGPVGVITAAVAGVATVGLRGTAELEQFGMVLTHIAREVGNVIAPALRLVTNMLSMLTASFRGTGSAGQMLATLMSPIGMIFEVLGRSNVQAAMLNLFRVFGMLSDALQPLRNLLANVADALLTTFVIDPLIWFIHHLTIAVKVMAELAKNAMQVVRVIAGFAGLGKLFDAPKRTRMESTLNQTGTEDAAGTFQRIQQAIFKSSIGEPLDVQDKQLAELEKITLKASEIITVVNLVFDQVRTVAVAAANAANMPAQVAQGGAAGAALDFGFGLNKLFGR